MRPSHMSPPPVSDDSGQHACIMEHEDLYHWHAWWPPNWKVTTCRGRVHMWGDLKGDHACRCCRFSYSSRIPSLRFIVLPIVNIYLIFRHGLKWPGYLDLWPFESKWGHSSHVSWTSFMPIFTLLYPSIISLGSGTMQTDDGHQRFMLPLCCGGGGHKSWIGGGHYGFSQFCIFTMTQVFQNDMKLPSLWRPMRALGL